MFIMHRKRIQIVRLLLQLSILINNYQKEKRRNKKKKTKKKRKHEKSFLVCNRASLLLFIGKQ